MILLEKHILLNALIQQEARLIQMADRIHHNNCHYPNPDSHKDWELSDRKVKEYWESDKGMEEKRTRQMAKDLKAQINIYEQHILEIALDEIKKLQS